MEGKRFQVNVEDDNHMRISGRRKKRRPKIDRFVGDITWGGVECSGAGAMRVEKRWNKRVENGNRLRNVNQIEVDIEKEPSSLLKNMQFNPV